MLKVRVMTDFGNLDLEKKPGEQDLIKLPLGLVKTPKEEETAAINPGLVEAKLIWAKRPGYWIFCSKTILSG